MKGRISLLSRLQGVSKMCLTYVQDALQSSKQKACDPFGFIYKAFKVLKYSVLRSRIIIR